MALGTMALLLGLGALTVKGLSQEGKHEILIKSNTKDPKMYVQRLVGERYMRANPNIVKEGYMEWLDHNFILSEDETKYWEKEFNKYKNELIQSRKQTITTQYTKAQQEYQNKIQDKKRKKHREKIYYYPHYHKQDLNFKMNNVINNTFIGNEIDKCWIDNNRERFLCLNTKLNYHEIEEYYKICWNHTYNNDKERIL